MNDVIKEHLSAKRQNSTVITNTTGYISPNLHRTNTPKPLATCTKATTFQQQQHQPQLLERVKRQQLNTPTQQEQHSCCY